MKREYLSGKIYSNSDIFKVSRRIRLQRLCVEKPKPTATCIDETESYKEKTFRNTKNELGRCPKN